MQDDSDNCICAEPGVCRVKSSFCSPIFLLFCLENFLFGTSDFSCSANVCLFLPSNKLLVNEPKTVPEKFLYQRIHQKRLSRTLIVAKTMAIQLFKQFMKKKFSKPVINEHFHEFQKVKTMPGTVPTIVFTFIFFEIPVLSFFKTFPYQFPRQKKSDNYAGNGSHNSFHFFFVKEIGKAKLGNFTSQGHFRRMV